MASADARTTSQISRSVVEAIHKVESAVAAALAPPVVAVLADAATSLDAVTMSDEACRNIISKNIILDPVLSDKEAAMALNVFVLAGQIGSAVVHRMTEISLSQLVEAYIAASRTPAAREGLAACALLWSAGAAVGPANMIFKLPPTAIPHIARYRYGANAVRPEPQQCSILHLAAHSGRAACCALLLDSGVFVDADARPFAQQSPVGVRKVDTPLQLAAFARHTHVVRVLVARGASTQAREPTTGIPMRDVTPQSFRIDGGRLEGGPPAAPEPVLSTQSHLQQLSGMYGMKAHPLGQQASWGLDAVMQAHAEYGRPLPITSELAAALRSKEQNDLRAAAPRFFLLASLAAREIGAMSLDSDLLGRLIVNQPKHMYQRPEGYDTSQGVDRAALLPGSLPHTLMMPAVVPTQRQEYQMRGLFLPSRTRRQKVLLDLMESMGVVGGGGAKAGLGTSTKAHAAAHKMTVMEGRFRRGLEYLRPGAEGALTARNSNGATPLHYVSAAKNDGELDVRLFASLGILALGDREERDEKEWIDGAVRRGLGEMEAGALLREAKRELEERECGPEWGVPEDRAKVARVAFEQMGKELKRILAQGEEGWAEEDGHDGGDGECKGGARALHGGIRGSTGGFDAAGGDEALPSFDLQGGQKLEYRTDGGMTRKRRRQPQPRHGMRLGGGGSGSADRSGRGDRPSTALAHALQDILQGSLPSLSAAVTVKRKMTRERMEEIMKAPKVMQKLGKHDPRREQGGSSGGGAGISKTESVVLARGTINLPGLCTPVDSIPVAGAPGADPTPWQYGRPQQAVATISPETVVQAVATARKKLAGGEGGGWSGEGAAASGAGTNASTPGALQRGIDQAAASVCESLRTLAMLSSNGAPDAPGGRGSEPWAKGRIPTTEEVKQRMNEAMQGLQEVVNDEAMEQWVRYTAGGALGALRQVTGMVVAHVAMQDMHGRETDAWGTVGIYGRKSSKTYAVATSSKSSKTCKALASHGTASSSEAETSVAVAQKGNGRLALPNFQPGPQLGLTLASRWVVRERYGHAAPGGQRRPPHDGLLLLLMAGRKANHPDVSPAPVRPAARGEWLKERLVVLPADDGDRASAKGGAANAGTQVDVAIQRLTRAHPHLRDQLVTVASIAEVDHQLGNMMVRLGEMGTADPLYVALLTARDSRYLRTAAQAALREACRSRGLDAVAGLLSAGADADAAPYEKDLHAGRAILTAASTYKKDPEGALDKVLLLLMHGAMLRGSFQEYSLPRAHLNRHRLLLAAAAIRGKTGKVLPDPLQQPIAVLPGEDTMDLGIQSRSQHVGPGSGSSDELQMQQMKTLLAHVQKGTDELVGGAGLDVGGILNDLPLMLHRLRPQDMALSGVGNEGLKDMMVHRQAPTSALSQLLDRLYGTDVRPRQEVAGTGEAGTGAGGAKSRSVGGIHGDGGGLGADKGSLKLGTLQEADKAGLASAVAPHAAVLGVPAELQMHGMVLSDFQLILEGMGFKRVPEDPQVCMQLLLKAASGHEHMYAKGFYLARMPDKRRMLGKQYWGILAHDKQQELRQGVQDAIDNPPSVSRRGIPPTSGQSMDAGCAGETRARSDGEQGPDPLAAIPFKLEGNTFEGQPVDAGAGFADVMDGYLEELSDEKIAAVVKALGVPAQSSRAHNSVVLIAAFNCTTAEGIFEMAGDWLMGVDGSTAQEEVQSFLRKSFLDAQVAKDRAREFLEQKARLAGREVSSYGAQPTATHDGRGERGSILVEQRNVLQSLLKGLGPGNTHRLQELFHVGHAVPGEFHNALMQTYLTQPELLREILDGIKAPFQDKIPGRGVQKAIEAGYRKVRSRLGVPGADVPGAVEGKPSLSVSDSGKGSVSGASGGKGDSDPWGFGKQPSGPVTGGDFDGWDASSGVREATDDGWGGGQEREDIKKSQEAALATAMKMKGGMAKQPAAATKGDFVHWNFGEGGGAGDMGGGFGEDQQHLMRMLKGGGGEKLPVKKEYWGGGKEKGMGKGMRKGKGKGKEKGGGPRHDQHGEIPHKRGTSARPEWLYAGVGERGEAAQIGAMVQAAYRQDHRRYLRCLHAMARWRAWRFWLREKEDRARRLVEFRRAVTVQRKKILGKGGEEMAV